MARSRASSRATLSPRVAASRAVPAPVTPPPTTTTSKVCPVSRSKALVRSAGPRRGARMLAPAAPGRPARAARRVPGSGAGALPHVRGQTAVGGLEHVAVQFAPAGIQLVVGLHGGVLR